MRLCHLFPMAQGQGIPTFLNKIENYMYRDVNVYFNKDGGNK